MATTFFIYSLSSLSNHVSSVPNHQTNCLTPIEMRFKVAQFGILGYELDLNELSEKAFNIVKKQVKIAKKHRELIQNADK